MYVSKEFLLSQLPTYRDSWKTVTENQDVHDIIADIVKGHEDYEGLYDCIGKYFIGADLQETCINLYNFCKQNIKYKEETEDAQTVAVPQGILTRGYGDCKHYASFIGGCLGAIERHTGKKIDWAYCFASYQLLNPTPYHVFVSVVIDGETNFIDPTPGADGKQPVYLIEKKIKKNGMALRRNIAGLTMTEDGMKVNKIGYTAAQLLLSSITQPTVNFSTNGTPLTPVVPINVPGNTPQIADNAAVVVPPEISGTTILLVGGGIGLLWYLNKNKKSVSGVIAGKKNKGEKNKSLLPLLLVGGAAAWWYFSQQQAAAPLTTDTQPGGTDTGTGANATAVPANLVTVSPEVALPADSAVYSQLYAYSVPWRYGIDRMTAAERQALYQYVFGFIKKGLRLYSYNGYFPDGWSDAALYNQIHDISTKWNWGLLN